MKKLKIYSIVLMFLVLTFIAVALVNVQHDLDPKPLMQSYRTPKSKYVRINNQNIHYTDEGAGVPIVFLHGIGDSLHLWYEVIDGFEDYFRVVTVTLPGHGLSGPSPRSDYSIQTYVSFLDTFIGKVGLRRPHLVGFSLGGYIAWRYTAKFSKNVNKLVLIASGGYPNSYRLPVFFLPEIPYGDLLVQMVTPRLMVKLMLYLAYLPQNNLVTPDLVQRYYDLNHLRGNRKALPKIIATLNNADPANMGLVKRPTLILWGQEDRVLPGHYAQQFAKSIKGSRLSLYKNIGHNLIDLVPKDTSADIKKFLAPQLFRE